MSELTFVILRFGFLLLLWIFIFAIVYALRSDLFGAPARRLRNRREAQQTPAAQVLQPPQYAGIPAGGAGTAAGDGAAADAGLGLAASATQTPSGTAEPSAGTLDAGYADLPSAGSSQPARTLMITSGVANGTEITLDEDTVTIGRSPDSTLVIVDEYTSTHHASLTRTPHGWQLTDLDSTNGTKVDNRRITGTVELPIFVPVTIGTTTFELRP